MAGTTIIGIDVGTTAVKALLITSDGRQLDRFAETYPTARPASGVVEQDPEDWFRHLLAALARFERGFDLSGLAGIALISGSRRAG